MTPPIEFITPNWPAPAQIKACTSLRQTTNTISLPTTPAFEIDLKNALSLPSSPIWIKQVHGKTIIEASPQHRHAQADASFSRHRQQVCAILTADCLPILLCNKKASVVAAIHAGWRGLALGIIENLINTLNEPKEDYLVWLGPAISSKHFEVGSDVYHVFTTQDEDLKIAFTQQKEEKWLADIYRLATIKLQKLGIQNIFGGNYCTYSQETLFYSYRRDKGHTGRMVSLIWIE